MPTAVTVTVDGQFKVTVLGVAVTTTLKQQVLALPQPSAAVKHTCVVPIGNAAPLARPAVRVVVMAPTGQLVLVVGVG